MPIIKSAKKRVRVANKAAIRNSKTKRSLKTALKSFRSAVSTNAKDAGAKHSKAQSELDKAVKKGVLHKNKASRLKKQSAAIAKAAGVSATASSKAKAAPAKKTVAKKPAAKKNPVKKTAAKKSAK
jgi:small subunit ribosomal protein S20